MSCLEGGFARLSKGGLRELERARNDPANQLGSGAWARGASDEALQHQLDGAFPGNQAYEAAVRELARREAARSEQLQLRWIMRTFWATIILGVAAIVATLIT
jgi:hypothetical protein